jgi:hypothetical protein
MQETYTYEEVLPQSVLSRYDIMEIGSAARIIQAVCPEEFNDIVEVLESFQLTAQLLLTPGGSRGPVPRIIDGMLQNRGWFEARVDLEKITYFFIGHDASVSAESNPAQYSDNRRSRTYQRGYAIDNVKGRIAADVEWNPKDGNLDRDFAAYRAWYDEGIIVAAVLFTRIQESTKELTRSIWREYVDRNPELADMKQPVDYSTSTTANFEKAVQRIIRGDLGTCPILMFGIGKKAWDSVPWDGKVLVWNKNSRTLELSIHEFKNQV